MQKKPPRPSGKETTPLPLEWQSEANPCKWWKNSATHSAHKGLF